MITPYDVVQLTGLAVIGWGVLIGKLSVVSVP